MNARRLSSVPTSDMPTEATLAPREAVHAFAGRHLVVTYLGCDKAAMADHEGLLNALRIAVEACGATLLKMCEHLFEGGGLTAVLLLAESHASIHTYPECDGCFVDLFTCGNKCRAEDFDTVLRGYLAPREAHRRVLLRSRDVAGDDSLEVP